MAIGRTVFATFKGDDKFIYAVARVRVLETRLLDKDIMEDLIEARDITDMYRILSDTEYAEVLKELEETSNYERLLDWELRRVNYLIYKDSPEPYLTDLFHLRHDCQNIKKLLRAKFLEEDVSENELSPSGLIEPSDLIEWIKQDYYTDLPDWLVEGIESAKKLYEEKGEFGLIDAEIDKAMFARQLHISKTYPYPFLEKYFSTAIDLANIRIYFRIKLSEGSIDRFKFFFIPGGFLESLFFFEGWEKPLQEQEKHFEKTDYRQITEGFLSAYEEKKSLIPLDRLCSKHLFSLLEAGYLITFGIEPIINYLLRKEAEIAGLRAIMALKSLNLDSKTIRERIAESFG
jgi:V/A-type H+-transporting ATPase subunit C